MKQAKNTENETTKKLNKDTHNNSIQTQQFNTKQIEDTNQNQPKNQGVPVVLVIFFPVGPVRKLKMPSQEKNHSRMDFARLWSRKTNVGARKIGLVT